MKSQTKDPLNDLIEEMKTVKDTLKSCPFCGNVPYYFHAVNGTNMDYLGCSACGYEFKCQHVLIAGSPPTRDLPAAWNRRLK